MPKTPGGLTILDGFHQRRDVNTGLTLVSTIPNYFEESAVIPVESFEFVNETLTVIDSGGATGGWVGTQLGEFNTGALILISLIEAEVFSVGGGISATGDVLFGLGSVEATNGTLSGSPSDLGALLTVALTGGAGSGRSTGPTLAVFKVSGTEAWFNIGVLDADITADADVVFSATVRTLWLDLTRGA